MVPTAVVTTDSIRMATGRAEESARLHSLRSATSEAYNLESKQHSHLRKKVAVYAAIQGTSLAASMLGFTSSVPSIPWRAVGISAAIPIGAALGYVFYTAASAERMFYDRERSREEWELDNYPEGEIDEMVEIYTARGLSEPEARHFVSLLARNKRSFVDIMMVDELGYGSQPTVTGLEACALASIAALVFSTSAVIPLLPIDHRKGRLILVASATAISILQAKMMLGAYTEARDTIGVIGQNAVWLTAINVLSRAAGFIFHRAVSTSR